VSKGNRGKAWEAQLANANARYRKAGTAAVWKTEPARNAKGVYLSKAPPDFMGILNDGRAVCFDAKDIKGTRFPFAKLADHQARDLEAIWKHNGVAFVALRLGGVRWFVPWGRLRFLWWPWREGSGRQASVDAEWLERCAAQFERGDWLSGVEG